jgi:hypothetical protein
MVFRRASYRERSHTTKRDCDTPVLGECTIRQRAIDERALAASAAL